MMLAQRPQHTQYLPSNMQCAVVTYVTAARRQWMCLKPVCATETGVTVVQDAQSTALTSSSVLSGCVSTFTTCMQHVLSCCFRWSWIEASPRILDTGGRSSPRSGPKRCGRPILRTTACRGGRTAARCCTSAIESDVRKSRLRVVIRRGMWSLCKYYVSDPLDGHHNE